MSPAKYDVDFVTKPSYKPLGYHLTCVPDPLYPWPLWQVKIIREQYDPGFIPIFRRMFYQTPAGAILTFEHHGVARYDPMAKSDRLVEAAPLPCDWAFERPNIIERWFEPAGRVAGSIRAKNNLPKAFVAWGDWVKRWVEETYWEASAAEKTAYLEDHGDEARTAKARLEAEAEAALANRDEAKYHRRLVSEIGADDYREATARAAGLLKPTPKPFVDLHKGA